jgi:hypothetical protein
MGDQLSFGNIILDPDAYRIEAARKSRRCLSCSSSFASNGPGNRICLRCKSTEVFQSSPVEFSVAAAF